MGCEKLLQIKVDFKKLYKFYIKHFLIIYVYGKSSLKRDYCDENVFLKVDRVLSKLITLLISNKKEFNHFFKSRSFVIFLLKLVNFPPYAMRREARNTDREARDEFYYLLFYYLLFFIYIYIYLYLYLFYYRFLLLLLLLLYLPMELRKTIKVKSRVLMKIIIFSIRGANFLAKNFVNIAWI